MSSTVSCRAVVDNNMRCDEMFGDKVVRSLFRKGVLSGLYVSLYNGSPCPKNQLHPLGCFGNLAFISFFMQGAFIVSHYNRSRHCFIKLKLNELLPHVED